MPSSRFTRTVTVLLVFVFPSLTAGCIDSNQTLPSTTPPSNNHEWTAKATLEQPLTVLPDVSSWKYIVVPHGGGPGDFFMPAFDDGTWVTGIAPFGYELPPCLPVATYWPADTDLLARTTFTVPPATSSVTVNYAVDNDILIYVNGHLVGSQTTERFCDHRSDPTWSLAMTIPPGFLSPTGINTIAVRAIDRGGDSFFEASVGITTSN